MPAPYDRSPPAHLKNRSNADTSMSSRYPSDAGRSNRPHDRERSPPPARRRDEYEQRERYKGDDRRDDRREANGRSYGRDATRQSPPPRTRDSDRDDRHADLDSSRRRSPPSSSRRSRSRSPPRTTRSVAPPDTKPDWGARRRSRSRSRSRSPGRPSRALASQAEQMRKDGVEPSSRRGGGGGDEGAVEKVKVVEPNFANSGALAAETNTLRGVVLKYNEPPEARKPVRSWRLYVFKGKEQLDLILVHRQSAYLFGRDRIVADIPIDHPSASKQHAVLQYRQVHETNEFGDTKSVVKPFIIDLDSANGTLVNDEMVPKQRFYELKTGDVLKFAFSQRDYVLLAE
ncbi:BZ3500_MvSof-1268-A1-R1_Chr3-3g06559 [Microbotryum saponariae]|uniref:BZ3500_MvSof-1268-A1-R1_Chr3-3g06559 protein n=1 Tax=Microbotryum saponariae TaxID=289078 RepID=A0A2X0NGB4_9BASI|nr:BZ3500_MvSof-1268-A1-R1_Chr3-3g06559 [Microbotryum saponariae]SDA04526.1 BZ3501_MvSof-1269-A2-R1_Chr3-2g06246 [Microbotryum saponariae]